MLSPRLLTETHLFGIPFLVQVFITTVAGVQFTNSDYGGIVAGQDFELTWSGDNTPVTLKLLTGSAEDLQPVAEVGEIPSSPYPWPVPAVLPTGVYALSITQSGSTNYSPQFTITGLSPPPSPSPSPSPQTTPTTPTSAPSALALLAPPPTSTSTPDIEIDTGTPTPTPAYVSQGGLLGGRNGTVGASGSLGAGAGPTGKGVSQEGFKGGACGGLRARMGMGMVAVGVLVGMLGMLGGVL